MAIEDQGSPEVQGSTERTASSPVRAALISVLVLIALVAVAATMIATRPVVVGTWTADGEGAEGTWSADGESPGEAGTGRTGVAELILAPGGRVGGTDGCNTIFGSWTATPDGAEIGQLASTLMFCEGMNPWLTGAASVRISGDTMTVLDDAGQQIGELVRVRD